MIKPPAWSSREESILLLNAYIDAELDAASVLDVERRLATDAALNAQHEQLKRLRGAIASQLESEQASDDLKRRIAEIAEPPSNIVAPFRRRPDRQFGWPHMAAAAALAAIIAGMGTFGLVRQNSTSNDVAAIIGDHRRALLAASPYDVASSDRHTVKPWFDSKLALSPQVVDLASSGFPLAGGRVEVLNGKPVPVLVYRRRAHVISVVASPHSTTNVSATTSLAETRDGYSVIRWRGRDFDYFAVSDIPQGELNNFVTLWREAAHDS